jgi:hypothetical protein
MERSDIEFNLNSVKEQCNIDCNKIQVIVDWFFNNNYTFDNSNFPTPLMKVLGDEFDLGDSQSMGMTTILMYEDLLRN